MNYVDAGYVRSGYIQLTTDTVGGLVFDPVGKRIVIPDDITLIDAATLYSRAIDWMVLSVAQDTSMKWLPAMRYTGSDPIPTGLTGATFFMINGWRISYNPNATAVSGVIFSEDYNTAYWSREMAPVFPITVSAVVNQVTTVQNVVTGDINSLPTAETIAEALITNANTLTVRKFLALKK